MGVIKRFLGIEGGRSVQKSGREAVELIRIEHQNQEVVAEIRRRLAAINELLSKFPRARQDITDQVHALEQNLGLAEGAALRERINITSALANLGNIERAVRLDLAEPNRILLLETYLI